MDLEEWEVIPSTKPLCSSSQTPLPSFLGPDLFVEADYFKCPTRARTAPPDPDPDPNPNHHHQQQQRPEQADEEEEEEEEEEEDEDEEDDAAAPAPPQLKDIKEDIKEYIKEDIKGISADFTKATTSTTPPFNWLEPDPLVFQRGPDTYDTGRKKELVADDKDCPGFNLWGLSVTGIGAICSFAVATAATLSVFALSTISASNSHSARFRPNPNIQFQICSHDKRIKEVVQRATGLNQAMSASRGITIPRAQISFGGHYEGI